MTNVNGETAYGEAEKLAAPIHFVGISLLVAVVANIVVIALFRGSPLVWVVVPFNLAWLFCVAWLANAAYGLFMAIVSVASIVFPVGVFIIMLLAYNRASKRLKELGYKVTFTGKLVQT